MAKREKIVFICLLTFLLLPNILGTFIATDLHNIGQRILYLLTSLCIYAFGLCVFKRRTFFYVASLGFLLSAIETVHLIINQATTRRVSGTFVHVLVCGAYFLHTLGRILLFESPVY